MNKIFLSYSTTDKDYLDIVSKKLGRARIVFDKLNFQLGYDFRDEIIRGLKSSSIFVFFASRKSLDSTWCKYELDFSNQLKLKGSIKSHICFIIDKKVSYSDLPEWMRNCKIVTQLSPNQAARDIESAYYSMIPEYNWKPFIGRNVSDIQNTLVSSIEKRIFLLSGLEGIGRRTFFTKSIKESLGINVGPYFTFDNSKNLEDLYLWCVDEIGDINTKSNFVEELKLFKGLSIGDQISEIYNRLIKIYENNFIPCLVDLGGMLNHNDGDFTNDMKMLLTKYTSDNNASAQLFIVLTRKPQIKDSSLLNSIFHKYVTPLTKSDTLLLLKSLCKNPKTKIDYNDKMLAEINEYMDGYPPACYYIVNQIQNYGIDAVIADKSMLSEFKVKTFSKYISNLKLSESEWSVLQYLATEAHIPLKAISVALEINLETTSKILKDLIDLSLVHPVNDSYSISMPIRNAILKFRGYLSKEDYKKITNSLTVMYWSDDNSPPSLEIVDATLHALASSGSSDIGNYKDLVRESTLIRLAKENYYKREYELAKEYAERAISIGSLNVENLIILFKSYVKMERWEEASSELQKIHATGDKRIYYLTGFMLKQKGDFKTAIDNFNNAILANNTSFSVYRDLAECLYRVDKYTEAAEIIQKSLTKQPDNIYILDIALRIYAEAKKFNKKIIFDDAAANDLLVSLERYDIDGKFIHHRKAMLLSLEEKYADALIQADIACQKRAEAFEAHTIKCDILIEMGRYSDAINELDLIAQQFKKHKKNIQIGLKIKCLTRQKNWQIAETLWKELTDQHLPIYQSMKISILQLKANDPNLSLVERKNANQEIIDLEKYVTNINGIDFLDITEEQEDCYTL